MLREEVLLRLPERPKFRWPLRMGIDRNFVKEAIMSIPYGSSLNGIADMFEDCLCDWHFRTNFDNTDNKESELTDISGHMAALLIDILKREHPKVFIVMEALKEMVRVLYKRKLGVKWTTPSGLPFRLQIPRRKTVKVCPVLLKGTHVSSSVWDEDDGTLNQGKNIKAICANFIHSIDAAILHKAVTRFENTEAPIVTIHDCLGSHANHMETLKGLYKQAVVDMFQQDTNFVMQVLNANLTPEEVTTILNGKPIENISKDIVAKIPESLYFIT
jgi:DNA-directed RNA polymerase